MYVNQSFSTNSDTTRLENELRERTAMLCALINTLQEEGSMIRITNVTDWRRAGTSREEFNEWMSGRYIKDDTKKRSRDAIARSKELLAHTSNSVIRE